MRWRTYLITLSIASCGLGGPVASAQELRVLGQPLSPAPAARDTSRKIVSRLRALDAHFRAQGTTLPTGAVGEAGGRSSPVLSVDPAGRVQVYIFVRETSEQALAVLRRHGLDIEIVNTEFAIVQGWLPIQNLESLAAESIVLKIRPPSYGRSRTGPVTSEGDVVHRCDRVRASGLSGAGVKVGVVSNGAEGLSASQAAGELPAVQVLSVGCCVSSVLPRGEVNIRSASNNWP